MTLKGARRHPITRCEYRSDFYRDYTRILHSRAFRRLRQKTQVFVTPRSDHICTRMEHSLIVASLARTVCVALNHRKGAQLSDELAMAIALGHDVGHAPFGHWGEKVLNECLNECLGEGAVFKHEIQGLRTVELLESPYEDYSGLNLTLEVRDGIALHCGEKFEQSLEPTQWKSTEEWQEFLDELVQSDAAAGEKWARTPPGTIEGCIVRFVDKIAYLGRDLEDALEHTYPPLLEHEDAEQKTAGPWWRDGRFLNRQFIDTTLRDLIENSTAERISFSDEMFKRLNNLYHFNMENIYKSQRVQLFFPGLETAMDSWHLRVLADFIEEDLGRLKELPGPERLAADFIAGMTDSFFISFYRSYFLPEPTDVEPILWEKLGQRAVRQVTQVTNKPHQ